MHVCVHGCTSMYEVASDLGHQTSMAFDFVYAFFVRLTLIAARTLHLLTHLTDCGICVLSYKKWKREKESEGKREGERESTISSYLVMLTCQHQSRKEGEKVIRIPDLIFKLPKSLSFYFSSPSLFFFLASLLSIKDYGAWITKNLTLEQSPRWELQIPFSSTEFMRKKFTLNLQSSFSPSLFSLFPIIFGAKPAKWGVHNPCL